MAKSSESGKALPIVPRSAGESMDTLAGTRTFALQKQMGTLSVSGAVPDILERSRDKTRQNEVDASALQFLFAEMVAYAQTRVTGITEFEQLLATMGMRVGYRLLILTVHRKETSANPKKPKRETRLLPTLIWVYTAFWKTIFGAQADSLERSTESERSDEYMISMNHPLFSRGISIPKEISQLSVEAFVAGIVEGALDALGFPESQLTACRQQRIPRAQRYLSSSTRA
ncbi:Trafficking protein particle complex subunit 31 [Malassezia yamatoensis]|uniref:Trafficking protein particle complex subunit 31 n=1 Tax=Malassezia yamatoensis TaxID=253288 RepID=A0AAJ5YT29_9BASI|nr:Trafficking protein particle complex subunit 31 [Malassezia yamatoensis]